MVDTAYLHELFPAVASLRQLTDDNDEGDEAHDTSNETRQQVGVLPKQPCLLEVLGIFGSGVGKIAYKKYSTFAYNRHPIIV